jgi:hypothetical protein
MALPAEFRVKLSTERAESIALTRVVVEPMSPGRLFDVLVGIAGKDVARIREILERGSAISQATRYRWEPIDASAEEVASLLRAYPDPDPSRRFDPNACTKIVLRGAGGLGGQIELSRQAASQRRLFRPASFWDVVIALGVPRYQTYSYREQADCFELDLDEGRRAQIHEAASLLKSGTLAGGIRRLSAARLLLLFASRT